MKLFSIHLHNIGTHKDLTIDLSSGVNALLGPVGAGKSTIINAIGAALFSSRVSSALVSEGEATGTIVATCSTDDRMMSVIRAVGKGSRWVLDDERGEAVASGVADVQAWLRRELQLPEGIDSDTLWEQAIAVPQGTHTAALLQRPAERKAYFGHLLGVGESTKIWDYLAAPVRMSTEALGDCSTQISTTQGSLIDAPARIARRSELDDTRAETADATPSMEGRYRDAADALARAIVARDARTAASQMLDVASERELVARHGHEAAVTRRTESERIKAEISSLRASVDAYHAAEATLDASGAIIDAAGIHRRTAEILPPQIARLGRESDELRQSLIEAQDAELQIAALQPDEDRRTSLLADVARLQGDLIPGPDMASYTKRIIGLEKRKQNGKNFIAAKQSEMQTEIHRKLPQIVCPQCQHSFPSTEMCVEQTGKIKEMQTAIDRYQSEYDSLVTELTVTQTDELNAETENKLRNEQIAKIRALRLDASKIPDKSKDIEKLKTLAGRVDVYAEQLADRQERLTLLRDELTAAELWLRSPDVVSELRAAETARLAVEQHRRARDAYTLLSGRLTAYADVGDVVASTRAALDVAHQSWLSAIDALASADHVLLRHPPIDRLQLVLDAERALLAMHRERITSLTRSIEDLDEQIGRDEMRARELAILERRALWLSGRHDRLAAIREAIRLAGPMVVRRRVAQVEQLAQRYYSELLDRTETVRWSPEDYGLSTIHGEAERPFERHSGGERMALSLALRLGLVHALLGSSALRLLILDEPTDGLAEEDRSRLAEQLQGLRDWYSQVVVVTHDSAFDALESHVIRLESHG